MFINFLFKTNSSKVCLFKNISWSNTSRENSKKNFFENMEVWIIIQFIHKRFVIYLVALSKLFNFIYFYAMYCVHNHCIYLKSVMLERYVKHFIIKYIYASWMVLWPFLLHWALKSLRQCLRGMNTFLDLYRNLKRAKLGYFI